MQGEIFALLGINGAGKTTTLECIEGVRKYDSGTIEVNGKTGVQLQTSSLMPECKVKEAIQLFLRWNKSRDSTDFSALNINNIQDKMYKTLSIGQKKRLHLALALIGNPDIVFLDEPTAGLDVEGRLQLHDEIRKLKKAGKTIVLASHDIAEVEELCDRIAILRDGQIAFIGTASELKNNKKNNPDQYQLENAVAIKVKASVDLSESEFTACQFCGIEQEYIVFTAPDTVATLSEILAYAKENGIEIVDIQTKQASLEQRFIEVSKKA